MFDGSALKRRRTAGKSRRIAKDRHVEDVKLAGKQPPF
jgi:hypothetical protein